MATMYHYQRGGQTNGPVSVAQLRELAASGQLNRDDLLRREGTENWEPAYRFKGLFPPPPLSAAPVAAATPAAPVPPPSPAGEANEPAMAAQPSPAPRSLATDAGQAFSDRLAKLRPIAEKYAREFELAMEQFLAMFAGSVCLVLLMLSTFMTWHVYSIQMVGVLAGVGDTRKTVGMEIGEGKFVCLLAVIGIGFFVACYFVKRLLPISLLVAGAAGTCSLLLALSYKHQTNRTEAESARAAKAMAQNLGTMLGDGGQKSAEENFIPRESYRVGLGVYLAILTSLIVAPTLVFTALFKPISLAFLQKESIHPIARKHGALLIAQGTAILVGLASYILRF